MMDPIFRLFFIFISHLQNRIRLNKDGNLINSINMMNSQFINVADTSFKERENNSDLNFDGLDILPDLFDQQSINYQESVNALGTNCRESLKSGKDSFRNGDGKESNRDTNDIYN